MVTVSGRSWGPGSAEVSSTGMTTRPCGSAMGAPVMMRTAVPGAGVIAPPPAGTSPTTGSVMTDPSARSEAWTRKPSIAELENGGTGRMAWASAASTQPVASGTGRVTGAAGVHRDSTRVRCSVMLAVGMNASPTDGGHGTVRLQETLIIDAVTGFLHPHGPRPHRGELLIRGPGAHEVAQRCLGAGEQAVADGAVAGQAGTVAVATERMRDRGDDAECAGDRRVAPAGGVPQRSRGGTTGFLRGGEGERLLQSLKDLGRGDHVAAPPLFTRPEGHLLDEAQLRAEFQTVGGQGDDIHLIDPGHDHRVDLDGVHTGFHGGLDGGQHPGQAVPARQGEVPLRVDGVQGDVHPVQAGLPQPGDPFVQAQAVGGQGGAYRLALIR